MHPRAARAPGSSRPTLPVWKASIFLLRSCLIVSPTADNRHSDTGLSNSPAAQGARSQARRAARCPLLKSQVCGQAKDIASCVHARFQDSPTARTRNLSSTKRGRKAQLSGPRLAWLYQRGSAMVNWPVSSQGFNRWLRRRSWFPRYFGPGNGSFAVHT